jgi:hypothetical protein
VKPVDRTLFEKVLWIAFVGWLLAWGLRGIQHPSPEVSRILYYGYLLLAVLAIFSALKNYLKTGSIFPPRQPSPREDLTRPERIFWKAAGTFLVVGGLTVVGIGGWFVSYQCSETARAQRTESVLARLGVESAGANSYWKVIKSGAAFAVFGLLMASGGVALYRTRSLP